ncbi:AQP8 protein, partial [Turnix velox]|nr:AQP8 protein [Turnix velox]
KETRVDTDTKPKPFQPNWYERYVQPCLAELAGSAFFIFIGCLATIENAPTTGVLQPALAHGLAVGLLVAVLGDL